MKLLLTSAGLTNKSIIKALRELTQEPFANLKLAFIPTAANVEDGDKSWLINNLNKCKELNFASIDIVDFSALPRDIWEKRLKEADIFMLGGGNTFHLLYSLQQSELSEMLPELLKTRIYVGISAGSMVTARHLTLSDSLKLYSEDIGKIKIDHGLGFVDFQIKPHFNCKDFPNVNAKILKEISNGKGNIVYAIDDNTAIKVDDDKISIISEGQWEKFS